MASVPRKVPLLVADALEHVLFAEVEFWDGAPINDKAAKLVEMPALGSHECFQE